jgi:hypothetical protein
MTTTAEVTAPTAAQIDAMARELIELKAIKDDAAAAVKEKEDDILPIVSRYGRSPDGAAKSRRLEGNDFTITATFGQTSSVVKKNVEKFREELNAEGFARRFDKIFMQDATYTVAPEAESLLAGLSTKLKNLFAKCVKSAQKKPVVKADPKVKPAA